MWLSSISSLALFVSLVHAVEIRKPLDCRNPSERKGNVETCSKPMDDVVAVVPGSSYVAKIECNDCPYVQVDAAHSRHIVKSDQILFLNLTLSHNNRTILLNDKSIYPLETIPAPPRFYVTQFPSNFSNADLTSGLTCANPYCRNRIGSDCADWCERLPLSAIGLDYFYTAKPSEYHGEDKDEDAEYWEIALDVIGGTDGYKDDPAWKFDHASQKMLWVLIAGKEAKNERYPGERDAKAASDLFGPFGEEGKAYEYKIVDMRLEARAYSFPAIKALTMWQKIGRFFGNDVWEEQGNRFVYLSEEWGNYGKVGTLRNMIGDFVHWDFWYLFWIISGSTVAGVIVLFGIYRLYFWLLQQKELAKWDGMDDVWDRLRSEPAAEEEDALLDSAYRDDPDEGGSSGPPGYTDEPHTMKPLPSKPLPEKPLPEVPLIDA